MNDNVDNPNTEGTDSFHNGSVDSRVGLGNHHTEKVVEENTENVEDNKPLKGGGLANHDEGINGIFMEHFSNKRNLGASVVDTPDNETTNETTPETLKTDNEGSSSLNVLKKIFFNDNLRSLNDLSTNDQGDSHNNLTSGSSLLITAVSEERSSSNSNETNGDESNTEPVVAVILSLKEDDGHNGRENDHGTTEHLPNGGIKIEQTNIHQASSTKIAHSRSSNVEIMFAVLNRIVDNFTSKLSLSISLLGSLALSAHTNDLVDNKARKHTNEHRLSLEPWLLELMDFSKTTFSFNIEDELLDGDGSCTEEKHTGNARITSESVHHSIEIRLLLTNPTYLPLCKWNYEQYKSWFPS